MREKWMGRMSVMRKSQNDKSEKEHGIKGISGILQILQDRDHCELDGTD